MSQYPPFQELNAARKRLIEKEQSQPDMVNLAMLASLARKIEPELLHALRFSLSDRFSVDRRPTVRTEAALWFSPFIESRGPDGITFLPAFSELLRERLKIEGSLLEAAHQVIQECHKNSPPIIHLEEELIYLSMSRCIMETERRQLLEQNIWRVVKAISTGKRRGLEEWIVEMWPRLPETACKNPLLAQLRNVSEIKILQYDSPASSKSNFTKLAKVDFSHVTTVVLDVQLVRDILRIGFLFDEGKIGFRVPNIEPITLGIQFPTVSRIITARVVPYGEFIDISAKSGPALIRTIDGQIYQIDPKLFEKQEIVGKPLTSDIFQPHILKEEPYVRELISGEQAASLYLFSWDEIPGNDNSRLIDYLKFNFNIDWVKTAKIEKTNDGDIIKVSNKENYLSLRLNDAKTKVILKINEDTTDEFTVKLEKGKLKICTYPTIERSVTKFIDAENEQKQRKEDKKYHITNKIKWPLEAEDLRIDALNYIHKTDGIKNFLEGNGLYIVCGLKGLGKTLVLRAKRMKYLELKTNTLQSYVMIPESEQVDVLASFNLLEYKWDLINNSVIWSNIWGLSIGLSIISHFFTRLDDKNKESLNWKLKQILKVRDKRHNNYLRLLLDYTTKLQSNPSRFVLLTLNSINKNILDANLFSELYANIFDILKQDIRSGCVVFIDQVDKHSVAGRLSPQPSQ